MNTYKLKLAVFLLCGLVFTPHISSANTTTLLSENTALFTIDFSFTDDLFNLEVPIAAKFGVSYLDITDMVGFTLESESPDGPAVTAINGLVLSKQPVDDVRYTVPTGTTATFTLLV